MKELLRTNDLVRLGWIRAALAGEGIEMTVLDSHASAIDGSIGALPRRVMVRDVDFERASALLRAAGEPI